MRKAVSPAEFAAQTGMKLTTVWEHCRTGQLKAKKQGRKWLIAASELEIGEPTR